MVPIKVGGMASNHDGGLHGGAERGADNFDIQMRQVRRHREEGMPESQDEKGAPAAGLNGNTQVGCEWARELDYNSAPKEACRTRNQGVEVVCQDPLVQG